MATVLVLVQFMLFGVMALVWALLPRSSSGLLAAAGVLLALLGLAVGLAAIGEHQRRNRALPRVSPEPSAGVGLVTTGLYAYARHPIYSGVLLVMSGAALAHGHAAAFSAAGALIGWLTLKSMYEETRLRQQFGAAYEQYQRQTGRFWPRW